MPTTPPVLTIARGDTVQWSVASNANTTHDVSSTGVHNYFQSPGGQGGMHHGQSYSFRFTSAGSFPYVCRIHRQDGMHGTVIAPVKVARIQGLRLLCPGGPRYVRVPLLAHSGRRQPVEPDARRGDHVLTARPPRAETSDRSCD